ncbi:polysaccharide lyase family 1 protein [Tulasnella calospora MUT 4182]|uniref:Polysaccharide lyase family 1 protein n=1 Tax=Tulasnella calospora MUT 4182 TaxID=1051891 RepID=A0A0C3QH55_9AGAM|nr:polysaccharide lyase family 1 protein [Tulasnella calospora MUT 4182]
MSRETAPHWAAARRALGLPHWPTISEPAYAALMFETACQGARCTRASYPTCDAIFVRGRFCNRCAKLELLSRDEIKVIFPDLPIALVSQLPASKHRAKVDRTLETGRFHTRKDVSKLWSIFQAPDFQGFTKHSLVQRLLPNLKAAKRANSIIADQVWAWIKKDAARRRREVGPHLSELWSRLQNRGWANEDYPLCDRDWVRLLSQLFHSPPRNEEAWIAWIFYRHGTQVASTKTESAFNVGIILRVVAFSGYSGFCWLSFIIIGTKWDIVPWILTSCVPLVAFSVLRVWAFWIPRTPREELQPPSPMTPNAGSYDPNEPFSELAMAKFTAFKGSKPIIVALLLQAPLPTVNDDHKLAVTQSRGSSLDEPDGMVEISLSKNETAKPLNSPADPRDAYGW